MRHGTLPKAACAITSAGQLKAKYVIHTMGSDAIQDDNDKSKIPDQEELKACIFNILDAAHKVNAGSIAMPQIWRRFYEGNENNNASFIKCVI